ncbi:MAG: integrase core domain-containing protein [Nitrospirales bacterium]|nr:integrase core domain-containing protein [Nitrospirales bacterium]
MRLFRCVRKTGGRPGKTFTKACTALDITQAFTSYNNPKGNADTERMMRTLKEELIWLREWRSHQELQDAIAKWVDHYNEQYHHSSLGYKTPRQFEQDYHSSHLTQFVAA